ncbi:MAG TPA: Asp-tRNA(Asn)/Glu-tRNA(Gln) amidotransferase subunit GatA, partial [Polyangiaceae bacterium]|jgi:aspartyl-tRNA(Asn)/glutamyl-tRNA(Gln) amidotransferase subunit A|nr:Asp-tRNA(Asn)/Glu-tRNA(Gln) amidotransferase subunit GatA [Polyangiaceae bacterium]
LARIRAADGDLHAFLHVAGDAALEQARALDTRRARGEDLGPLAGVPVAVKDALCTRGIPSTAGSKILGGYVPPYDAAVIERLRAAGAVVVGKTNMDEFAMGSSTENSAFGVTRNPWDLARTPGGSSGGSAAAVAARLAPCALGSDTGGSIRQPASFTGTVGLKPTYGRVSRYGLIAFASSLDQIGPFATDVRGAARVLSVIAGHDPRDSTSLDVPTADWEGACDRGVKGLRVGVPDEYFAEGLDPEVHASARAAVDALKDAGCVVRPVTLPHTRYAVATYYVLATAEASSNLARFDGVRYGLRVDPRRDLRAMYGATRDAGFGHEVKRRILLGTFVLSAGYYDAYYLKAQKARTLVRRDFEAAFRDVDVLCSPTAPTPAFRLGEKVDDPLSMYLSDIYTLPASLAGLPAMSVPCAPTKSGLPVGLHVVARPLDEATMLAVASACEAAFPARSPGASPP